MIFAVFGASGLGAEYMSTAERINLVCERYQGSAEVIEEKSIRHWDDFIFVDDNAEKWGTVFGNGHTVYGLEDAIAKFGIENLEFVVAIGEPNVKDVVFDKLDKRGCNIGNLFYPAFLIPATAKYGRGIVIHKGSSMPPYSEFGNNVLIQGLAIMGHHVKLGDNVVISSQSFIGGETTIGKNTYVGPSACLRNGITIGENVIIGMGSVVTKDIPDNAVAYGNPAKVVRINESGRVFSK